MIEEPYDFQHEDRAKKAEPFVMVECPITSYQLWCQLTAAFEGGMSNYWISSVDRVDEDKLTGKPRYLQDWPFLGGALLITVNEDPGNTKRPPFRGTSTWRLDRKALIEGAKTMAALKKGEGGHHWGNVVQDDGDAETGDVYLQCCLFGEIIFG
jgi:hypothetical protein